MARKPQSLGIVRDPSGFDFYKCGMKRYESLRNSLQAVHASRVRIFSNDIIRLEHGPQDLALESYQEVLQLLRKLANGLDLAFALAEVTGLRPGNYIEDIDKGTRLARRLAAPYDADIDGPPRPHRLYKDSTKAGRKQYRERPKVNSTPLPVELTPEERRKIWQPPSIRRRG